MRKNAPRLPNGRFAPKPATNEYDLKQAAENIQKFDRDYPKGRPTVKPKAGGKAKGKPGQNRGGVDVEDRPRPFQHNHTATRAGIADWIEAPAQPPANPPAVVSQPVRQAAILWEPSFLAALWEHRGNVSRACEAARINRSTAYQHRNDNPQFAAAWDEVLARGVEELVEVARQRAVEGVLKPDYYQGKVVGATREYSDRLAELYLKAELPDKFGDSVVVRLSKEDRKLLQRFNLILNDLIDAGLAEIRARAAELDSGVFTVDEPKTDS